jgi:histidinol-phosphate/aromatic aminotransferase/cobyric acid decarboxylase-like protein
MPASMIRKVVENARGLVILDEAYAEFAGERGMLREAASMERLLVCRTFSKAYGLAGLRAGYGVASGAISLGRATARHGRAVDVWSWLSAAE